MLDTIQRHALEQPCREVCGVLLGAWGPPIAALGVVRGHNVLRASDQYLIDAASLLAADDAARARGMAIVGFYHSHPNHVPIPSRSDRATAWAGFAYLIVGANAGQPATVCAWVMDSQGIHPLLIAVD